VGECPVSLDSSKARTKNYFAQTKGSFIFKILAIACSFLSTPIMIKYLGNEQYGIWSTLLSIVSWIIFFDIGIGNGLRNKISESLAKNNKQEAQNYISTAYVIIGFLSLLLFLFFLVISNLLSWKSIFNTETLSNNNLKNIVNITVFFMFTNFWLSLINQVFNGIQKTSMVIFNQFLSNFFMLISIFVLYSFFKVSLLNLAFSYGLSIVMSSVLLSVWFYEKNQEFIPKIKYYNKMYVKSLTSLGFKFFVIQIAVVVVFTTNKIIITQLFGPEYVTGYDVVFKLFSMISIAHNILMAPLWPAYSDAYHKGDFFWIKNTLKKQLKIYMLIVIATILLGFLTKPIIYIWIGKEMIIDNALIIVMVIFILISTWNNIFAYFINATNKLNVQINTSIIAMIVNIPISIFLVKYFKMGTYGVVLATCISLSFYSVFGPLQVLNILKRKIK
jgi:O-antigen/teichoic acid export membrane protein